MSKLQAKIQEKVFRKKSIVTAAIWATLFVLVFSAFSTVSSFTSAAPTSGSTINLAAEPTQVDGSLMSAAPTRYVDNAEELLPAFRWNGNTGLYKNLNILDEFRGTSGSPGLTSVIADFLFSISSTMWTVLLFALSWALSVDVIHTAGEYINRGFRATAIGSLSSPLVGLFYFIMLAPAIVALMKGNVQRAVALFVTFGLAFGTLITLSNNSAPSTSCTAEQYAANECVNDGTPGADTFGTPAWFGVVGTNFVNDTATSITSGFGYVVNTRATLMDPSGTEKPNCDAYTNVLYQQFAAAAQTERYGGNLRNSESSQTALVVMSQLWQEGYQRLWEQAQYNWNSKIGERVGCHRLEEMNGTTPKEAARIAHLAYGLNHPGAANGWDVEGLVERDRDKLAQVVEDPDALDSGSNRVFPNTWEPFDPNQIDADSKGDDVYTRIFSTQLDGDNTRRNMTAWAVCAWGDNGWTISQDLKALEENGAVKPAEDCARWWDKGFFRPDGGYDPFTIQGTELSSSETVKGFSDGMNGKVASQRLILGLVAAATAGIYLWGIGSLALGSLIAQVGLFALLICLPITILLAALPNKEYSWRLLKLTGTFMLAKFITVTTITIMLFLIITIQSAGLL